MNIVESQAKHRMLLISQATDPERLGMHTQIADSCMGDIPMLAIHEIVFEVRDLEAVHSLLP